MENEVNNNDVSQNTTNSVPESIPEQNSVPEMPVEQPVTTESVVEVPVPETNSTPDTLENNTFQQPETQTQVGTSYNTNPTPQKPKKGLGIGIIILIAVLAVGLIGGITYYFMSSTPKAMYKTLIKKAFKEVNSVIDDYDKQKEKFEYKDKALILEAELSGDTNIADVKKELNDKNINLKDYTIGGKIGLDTRNQEMIVGASIKGLKEKIGLEIYAKDSKLYIMSDLLDEPIVIDTKEDSNGEGNYEDSLKRASDSLEDLINNIDKVMEQVNKSKLSTKDSKYVVNAIRDAIIDSLDESKMKKESSSIEVDGKTIKVTKVSYELDKENVKNTIKKVCEKLLNDDKFIGIIADVSQMEKSKIKDALNELKSEAPNVEMPKDTYINLYVKGLTNSFVGLSLEVEGKEVITYYKNKNQTEITITNNASDSYGESKKEKVVILITEEKKSMTIVGKYNGKTIVELELDTSDEDVLNITRYLVNLNDHKMTGHLKLKVEQTKSLIKLTADVEIKDNDEYVSANGFISLTSADKLTDKNISNAQKAEDVDGDKLIERIKDRITKDEALNRIYESYDEDINKTINGNKKSSGNIIITGSYLACKSQSNGFDQEIQLSINDKLKTVEKAIVVYSINESDLDETEKNNSSCATFKASSDEVIGCESETTNGKFIVKVEYDPSVVNDSMKEEISELTTANVKKYYEDNNAVCTLK